METESYKLIKKAKELLEETDDSKSGPFIINAIHHLSVALYQIRLKESLD